MQSKLIVPLLRFGINPISTRHDNFSKLRQTTTLFHIIPIKITRCNREVFCGQNIYSVQNILIL